MAHANIQTTAKAQEFKVQKNVLGAKQKKQLIDCLNTAGHYFECASDKRLSTQQSHVFLHKARKKAQEALLLVPDTLDALNLLSRIELEERQYDMAQVYINQALKIAPEHAGLLYSLGHLELAKENFQQAVDAFSLAETLEPGKTRSLSSLAFCLFKTGNYPEAFQYYRELIRLDDTDAHIKANLFECCQQIRADYYSAELEQDLLHYFNLNDVDYNQLAGLAGSILTHKYQDNPENLLDRMSADNLLTSALNKTYFCDEKSEILLTQIRNQLLIESLSASNISSERLSLILAFSQHSFNNGYVFSITETEQNLLQALEELFETASQEQNWTPSDIAGALVIYAMYYPLKKLPIFNTLSQFRIDQWPFECINFVSSTIQAIQQEEERSQSITSLNAVKNEHSLKVQSQYEEYPYPRWLSLGHNTPTDYGSALKQNLLNFTPPRFFNQKPLKVLIAGCGTGRHALQVARNFRNVEVTAIDLSRHSLAYADQKAEFYDIQNLDLYQADLLQLEDLNEKYQVIECSGVLHHMAEPEQGLLSLLSKLVPKGVIKLALYSRQARQIINQFRSYIKEHNIEATDKDIRHFRQLLMHQGLPQGLAVSSDFFSMSGCKDLLFHEYERQYSPRELEQLCQQFDLKFLGFVGLSQSTIDKYHSVFGKDECLKSLANWQIFEDLYPDTFSGMYQFYCQKLTSNVKSIH